MYFEKLEQLIESSELLHDSSLVSLNHYLMDVLSKSHRMSMSQNIHKTIPTDIIVDSYNSYLTLQNNSKKILHEPIIAIEDASSLLILDDQYPLLKSTLYVNLGPVSYISQAVLENTSVNGVGFMPSSFVGFLKENNTIKHYKKEIIHIVLQDLVQNTVSSLEQVAHRFYFGRLNAN